MEICSRRSLIGHGGLIRRREREGGELGLVEGRVSVRKRDEFKIG